jgi:formylglycine-generating enzyme required for sulfatase activity
VWVTWYDALAFCRWLGQRAGIGLTLPSEAEWEKAARGDDGRIYPWGDEPPNDARCSFGKPFRSTTSTTPVGQYSPQGDSPYGCADMASNVWEWTRSLWGTDFKKPEFGYPYDPGDGRENLEAESGVLRVLRGGAFYNGAGLVCCAYRDMCDPYGRYGDYGFRVVASPVHL